MTQPQPHQRSSDGGAPSSAPDTLNPAELQRLLRLREEGPRSPALPPVDFTIADHPLDLMLVVEQVIFQSGRTGDKGRVQMVQVLAAASHLLARLQVLVGGALDAGEPLPMSDNSDTGPSWQPDEYEQRAMRTMLRGISAAEHNIQLFLSPMLRGWLANRNPEALAAGELGDYQAAHRALISDAIFEMLQMDRRDFELATDAPVVDS